MRALRFLLAKLFLLLEPLDGASAALLLPYTRGQTDRHSVGSVTADRGVKKKIIHIRRGRWVKNEHEHGRYISSIYDEVGNSKERCCHTWAIYRSTASRVQVQGLCVECVTL